MPYFVQGLASGRLIAVPLNAHRVLFDGCAMRASVAEATGRWSEEETTTDSPFSVRQECSHQRHSPRDQRARNQGHGR